MKKPKQTVIHDWLGDAAENLVRYYFACEDFEVFGGNKWGADIVGYDKQLSFDERKWWKIEVKSTDRIAGPFHHANLETLARKADLLVQIRFFRNKPIKCAITKLSTEERGKRCWVEKVGDIREFLYGSPKKN